MGLATMLENFLPEEAGSTASLVNRLLRRMPAPTTYVEIGVASGKTLLRVQADRVVGVDPSPEPFERPERCTLHLVASSTYFREMVSADAPISVAFVDGLHLWETCLEDIISCFEHLKQGGYVIVDDVYPPGIGEAMRAETYEEAVRCADRAGLTIENWMGDVWRSIVALTGADVPGLRWATVPITRDRYHTIFWWGSKRRWEGAMRDAISAGNQLRAGELDVGVVGDFSRSGMAPWYRYQPYWRFLLAQRLREVWQSLRSLRRGWRAMLRLN